ncbi:MAG: hypothetical protein K2X02_02725 [Alphaproteobacteria bacterium]|nr:hypothetical protein [Alphaproteobacteria bacterium]
MKILYILKTYFLIVLLSTNVCAVNEDWFWRESFDGKIRGKKIPLDPIHTDLARQEFALFERLDDRRQGKPCSTNIVLASLSFLVEDSSTGELHCITEPIGNYEDVPDAFSSSLKPKPFVFLSDSAFKRGSRGPAPSLLIDGLTQSYDIVTPYSLNSIEKILGLVQGLASNGAHGTSSSSSSPPALDPQVFEMLIRETTEGLECLGELNRLEQEFALTGDNLMHLYRKDATLKRLSEFQKQKGALTETKRTIKEASLDNEQTNLFLLEVEHKISQKEEILKRVQTVRDQYDALDIKGKYNHSEQNLLYHLKEGIFDKFLSDFREKILQTYKHPLFRGAIFHLHSRLDICERCAPVISLESHRIKSRVIEILQQINPPETSLPTFQMLASVRQEFSNSKGDLGYRRHLFGHDGRFKERIDLLDPASHFYMKVVEPLPQPIVGQSQPSTSSSSND